MAPKQRSSPATPPVHPNNGDLAEPSPVRAAAFAWEDWFRQATTSQQAEALALAQRQGHVCVHQLPAPANGAKPHSLPASGRHLDTLRALLAGKTDTLPRAAPPNLAGANPAFTQAQQLAAGRILGAPDLVLLRAPPGPAALVLAEAIVQAARAGQRVLLLTHQRAHLDHILHQLLR